MASNEENGNDGSKRNNRKDDPLTAKDVRLILDMIPQGLDADEFILRLANEAVWYARFLGKA